LVPLLPLGYYGCVRHSLLVLLLVGFALGIKYHPDSKELNLGIDPLIDTCGTGGSGLGTINVSTCSAIVAAAAGISVAKHGNYKITSESGSANVLEALGYNLNMSREACGEMLRETGFTFLLAPKFYPCMGRVSDIRKKIGKTIFNKLGPLCNPANPSAQLVGVYDETLCEPFCYALDKLGVDRALVVCSKGLDEISNVEDTLVYELNNREWASRIITPEDFGFPRAKLSDIQGGGPEENAEHIRNILKGAKGPMRDFTIMNSAAIYLGEGYNSLEEAMRHGEEVIDSGAALEKLEEVISYSQNH